MLWIKSIFGRRFVNDKLVVNYNGKEVPIFSCKRRKYEIAVEERPRGAACTK